MFLTSHNTASYLLHSPITNQQRRKCFCHYPINPKNPYHFATLPGKTRDYIGKLFKVWQDLHRQIIQALDVIGLDYYYTDYPVLDAKLTCFYRIIPRKIHQ